MKDMFFGDTLFFTKVKNIYIQPNGGWLKLGGQYETNTIL